MPTVQLSGPTNSTMFTTCCGVAICDDQAACPRCGEDIYPFFEGMSNAEREKLALGAYSSPVRRLRWEAAYGPIRRK